MKLLTSQLAEDRKDATLNETCFGRLKSNLRNWHCDVTCKGFIWEGVLIVFGIKSLLFHRAKQIITVKISDYI